MALPRFSEASAAWALEAGADEFLSPPFNPGEVLARISVVLRLRQDRRILIESPQKFSRLFSETGHPLFFCQRTGQACEINPSLRRFLGYTDQGDIPGFLTVDDLLYGVEDKERFRQVLSRSLKADHVKVRLINRQGQPMTVLLKDLTLPEAQEEIRSFQVEAVGSPSPLRKAIQGLVDHSSPAPGTTWRCSN